MMNRKNLHTILLNILGTENVYFQPPTNLHMNYPAIVYSRDKIVNTFADNSVYKQERAYQIIVIDKDPDSDITNRISQLPLCRYERHYVSDNLNHDLFTLYF